MNAFPKFYGARFLGVRKFLLLLLCVTVGTASITYTIITGFDFHRAVLSTASGTRPHISIHLPLMSIDDAQKIQRKLLGVSTVSVCEPSLRLEGTTQIIVRDQDGDIQFADSVPMEIVGYEFAVGHPSPVAFEKVYPKANRCSNPDDTPVSIITTPDPMDKGRAIVSDNFRARIFQRPMPAGNDFELGLPFTSKDNAHRIFFNARTAGAYMVSALVSSANYRDVVYVRLDELQNALSKPGKVNSLDIRLYNPFDSTIMVKRIATLVPAAIDVIPWTKPEADSLEILHILDFGVTVGVMIVGLTAALSICVVLFMVVSDKMREIAMIAAMGAQSRIIYQIFIHIGSRIGILGSVLGVGAGTALSIAISKHQTELMSNFYARPDDSLPIPWGLLIASGAVMAILSVLACIGPCMWALRSDPIKLLAHE